MKLETITGLENPIDYSLEIILWFAFPTFMLTLGSKSKVLRIMGVLMVFPYLIYLYPVVLLGMIISCIVFFIGLIIFLLED